MISATKPTASCSEACHLRRYTFNTDSNLLNSTFYNIKEREGFIIRPFTVPVASAAVKYSMERDGYTIEPSFDLNTQNPYLSVAKRHRNANIKARFASLPACALPEQRASPSG